MVRPRGGRRVSGRLGSGCLKLSGTGESYQYATECWAWVGKRFVRLRTIDDRRLVGMIRRRLNQCDVN